MTGSAHPANPSPDGVRWATPQGRWLLAATVLGSGLVFLDATSSNVALPAIEDDLGAGVAGLQWTINAYTLALASLILLGGSLSDRFGRRRIFLVGTVWFALASLACGVAPSTAALVGARALQGVGGALLTPGSLAILQACFASTDRARAVGAWSGLSGIAAAAGPLVGGWLVEVWTWRLIFLSNLPVAAVVVIVAVRHVPEPDRPAAEGHLDAVGALLGALGLGLTTWSLIEFGEAGPSPSTWLAAVAGLVAIAAFLVTQARRPHPLLPLEVFASRQFVGVNLVTLAVYAALSGVFFLLFLQLQQVLGYSPTHAGAAALPVTGLLLVLSARAGALSQRIGPRVPMTVGPLLFGVGALLLTRVEAGVGYVGGVLPAVLVLGLGLALTVAPLTATALAAVSPELVGVASGVNNTVARIGGLLAVATLPPLAGISGAALGDPVAFSAGFRIAMIITAGVAASGAVLAWLLVRNEGQAGPPPDVVPAPSRSHCPVAGPPVVIRTGVALPPPRGGGGSAPGPGDRA